MIALDTNVIVRLLIGDDPRQFSEAERCVREARERGEICFISDPVLCALEWVLESCYDATRPDVLVAVRDLMGEDGFELEDREALRSALEMYQRGKADLSDYLIGLKGQSRGARVTYTFDRALRQEAGFVVLA